MGTELWGTPQQVKNVNPGTGTRTFRNHGPLIIAVHVCECVSKLMDRLAIKYLRGCHIACKVLEVTPWACYDY